MHIKQFLVLSFCLFYAVLSQAETYEWVDEKGITNYGDSIPAQYKHKAKKVEIKENVISAPVIPTIKKEESSATDKPEQAQPVILEVPPTRDLTNSEFKTDESCEVQKQRYKESQNCFAQYRNVRGGISEEGVKRCAAIQQPVCNTNTNSNR